MSPFLFIYMVALLAFLLHRRHLLSTLLVLEFLTLALYFLLCTAAPLYAQEMFSCFLFLAVSVSEGALGLSLTVFFTRMKGSDFLTPA